MGAQRRDWQEMVQAGRTSTKMAECTSSRSAEYAVGSRNDFAPERAMRQFKTQELSDVVADAATRPSELTRHEIGEGVAVSFLYDGDGENPDTCQWRVVAPNEKQLRQVVWQLVELLTARGVRCKPAHFNGGVSHFRDEGPWGVVSP